MTNHGTLQRVAEELESGGITTTVEYPDHLSIDAEEFGEWAFGTANGVWGGHENIYSGDWENRGEKTFHAQDSTIAGDSNDVDAIVTYIIDAIMERHREADPDCSCNYCMAKVIA